MTEASVNALKKKEMDRKTYSGYSAAECNIMFGGNKTTLWETTVFEYRFSTQDICMCRTMAGIKNKANPRLQSEVASIACTQ